MSPRAVGGVTVTVTPDLKGVAAAIERGLTGPLNEVAKHLDATLQRASATAVSGAQRAADTARSAIQSSLSRPLNTSGLTSSLERSGGQAGQAAGAGFSTAFLARVQSAAASAARVVAGVGEVATVATAGLAVSIAAQGAAYNKLGQKVTAAFTTMLGTREAAAGMVDELAAFARESPFPRQIFIEATQQLLGFGAEARSIVPAFSAIEDAVAATGGGAAELREFADLFARIASEGEISANTIEMFGFRGIDVVKLMADQTGRSVAEMRDHLRSGAMSGQESFDLLAASLEARFGGAAGLVKKTYDGAIDRVKGAMRDIGSSLLNPFIGFTGGGAAVTVINGVADALRRIQEQIVPKLLPGLSEIGNKLEWFGKGLQAAFVKDGGEGVGVIAKLIDLLGQVSPVLAGLGSSLGLLTATRLPFLDVLLGGLPKVAVGVAVFLASIPEVRSAFVSLAQAVAPLIAALAMELMPILVDFQQIVATVLPPAIAILGAGFSAILATLTAIAPIVAAVTGFLADHAEVVGAAAAAWAGLRIAAIAGSTWTAVTTGATVATAAVGGLRAAIVSLAATRGVSTLTASMGVLRSSIVSTTGAVVALTAAVGLGVVAWQKWGAEGRGAGERLAEQARGGVEAVYKSAEDYQAALERFRAGEAELVRQYNDIGRFDFFDIDQKKRLEDALKSYRAEGAQLVAEIGKINEVAAGTGLSFAEVIDQMALLKIDPAAFRADEIEAQITSNLDQIKAAAEAAGVSIEEAMTMDSEKLKADAESIKQITSSLYSSLAGMQSILKVKDEPVDPSQIEEAERAVVEARRRVTEARTEGADAEQAAVEALTDAEKKLQDLRDSDSPLNAAKIQAHYQKVLADTRAFSSQIQAALAVGYDPAFVTKLIAAGPAEAGPLLAELTGDTAWTMVEMVNQAEAELNRLNLYAVEQARLTQMAINSDSQKMVQDLSLATVISAELMRTNGNTSVEELARVAGTTVDRVREVADEYKLELGGMQATTAGLLSVWERISALVALSGSLGASAPPGMRNAERRWGGIHEYAMGGLTAYGARLREFASGGITAHVATGDVYRYAEPSTGGEAFIPRLGDRGRSEQIAKVVARWLGGVFLTAGELSRGVTPMANGGIGSYAVPASIGSGGATSIDQSISIGTVQAPPGSNPRRHALALVREVRSEQWLQGRGA